MNRTLVWGVAFCIALCVVLLGAGTALGGHSLAFFTFEPEEVDVDPGETVEIALHIQASTAIADEGVQSYATTVRFDPTIASVRTVDTGDWIAQGDDTTIESNTTIHNENGTVRIEQYRNPPAGGVLGSGIIATLTLDIHHDAEPAIMALTYEDTDVQLLDLPLRTMDRDGYLYIGGGVSDEDSDLQNDANTPDTDGVILANDTREDSASPTETATESQPGFGVLLALFGIILGFFRRVR